MIGKWSTNNAMVPESFEDFVYPLVIPAEQCQGCHVIREALYHKIVFGHNKGISMMHPAQTAVPTSLGSGPF